MMPLASQDTNTGTDDATWPNSHVAPHFYSVDLMNTSMPLAIHSALCDAVQIVLHDKYQVVPYFNHIDLTNAVFSFMLLLASCEADTSANDITWQK